VSAAVQSGTGGDYANGISAADFGNDGVPDVVVSNSISNTISVFKGVGDGTFLSPTFHRVRRGPTGSTVNDFNKDGFIDIAVSCQVAEGAVTVLLNNQAGGFHTHSIHMMPLTFRLTSGDLNGDGFFEVMATNPEYNRITVLVNDGVWSSPVPIRLSAKTLVVTHSGKLGGRASSDWNSRPSCVPADSNYGDHLARRVTPRVLRDGKVDELSLLPVGAEDGKLLQARSVRCFLGRFHESLAFPP
jgi:hypothetical protein